MFDAHDRWFVTCRTFQARALMAPRSPTVREVCGGVLAKAAAVSGVRLHAYVFLSTHLHLIVHAQGQQLACFMKYLLGNLSKKLGPLCRPRWWGRFWERRYAATPILDEVALEERLRYLVAHGVKEGLVARLSDWEGLHCVGQLVDEAPRRFPWFNWTQRWQARGQRSFEPHAASSRYADSCAEPVELALEPLPHWAAEPAERRKRRMALLVEQIERDHASPRPLGAQAIRRQSTRRRPERKRTLLPACHASSRSGRNHYRHVYRAFCDAFREASARWLRGDVHAEFPKGSFKPHVYGGTRMPHLQIV